VQNSTEFCAEVSSRVKVGKPEVDPRQPMNSKLPTIAGSVGTAVGWLEVPEGVTDPLEVVDTPPVVDAETEGGAVEAVDWVDPEITVTGQTVVVEVKVTVTV